MEHDRFILFSSLLNDAQKSIARLKYKKMDSYGLGSAHTLCLCVLYANAQGVNKTELAKLCGVDKAQISRIISDLLEKNYVTVATPERNYRQKYVLSGEGLAVTAEIKETVRSINDFVGGNIPKEQLDIFYATFKTICDNLAKAEEIF